MLFLSPNKQELVYYHMIYFSSTPYSRAREPKHHPLEKLQTDMTTELEERLVVRKDLRIQYQYVCLLTTPQNHVGVDRPNRRRSYFNVIHHFGPEIRAVIVSRCNRRDRQLSVATQRAIFAHAASGGPEGRKVKRLKTQLELQTVLCAEYRYVRNTTSIVGFDIPFLKECVLQRHQSYRTWGI